MKWDLVIVVSFFGLLFWISLGTGSIIDVKKPTAEVALKKCVRPCYNGVCRNGTCQCSPGWTGSQCESCFGRVKVTKRRGFITEGPGNYSRNLRCSWLLDGDSLGARRVSLKLDSFVTECGWDNVFIYDGDGMYGTQLAALSGILSPGSDVSRSEFVAESGQAFVYFYSDLAYNMSGFNISYRFDGCPSDCNGRGVCEGVSGICRCVHNWTGPACEFPSCLRSCSSLTGKCDQKTNKCICDQGWHGPNCDVRLGNSAWETVWKEPEGSGRASHGVAVHEGLMWVVGGYHFQGANFSSLKTFNFSTSTWSSVSSVLSEDNPISPLIRYDHSLVEYQDALYMFGGIVNEKNVSSEFWCYEIKNRTWRLETSDHMDHYSLPYHSAGHTAHIVGNVMIVIFGYNHYRGYMNAIQEYNFLNKTWARVLTTGAVVLGTYGHSSVYDVRTESIFVYGGFFASGQTLGSISDRLYKYQPLLRRWEIMQGSGNPVFRHAAGLVNGVMIVVGGNAHNESMPSRQTQCYANKILAYDIDCGTWYPLDTPSYVSPGVARYGHVMVNNNDHLYIHGGFDGRMLDDILKFIPGQCGFFKDLNSCVKSREGSKCVWVKGRCMQWSEAENQARFDKSNSSLAIEKPCVYTGVGRTVSCSEIHDCATCTTAPLHDDICLWCDGKCQSECADAKTVIVRSEECPRRSDWYSCHMYQTCVSCKTRINCVWNIRAKPFPQCVNENQQGNTILALEKDGKKDPAAAILSATSEPTNVCNPPCSFYDDCSECTSNACMWCSTVSRCVNINSYLAAFPYGQCTQWTSTGQECTNPTDCSSQQTCDQCQAMGPRCGWCDDGSGTGLGECLQGGLGGPVEWDAASKKYEKNPGLCQQGRWYFFDCPACQCNGHGHCENVSDSESRKELKCESCSGMTVGPHCDTCMKGYYGNALNGGNCTECMCNEQATDCDPHSGECYCTTKGVSGKHCDKCDQKYIGDPKNRTCFYELSVDFIFTFRLDAEDQKDKYVSKINFITRPAKRDTDVIFKLTCTRSPAKVNLSVYSGRFSDYPGMKRRFLANTPCNEIERRFSHDEFEFGTDANTTFFVFLYDFQTPVDITISFAQTPPIDWIRFFITFACCFILLLVVAAVLWKVKIRFDLYRRRQRMFVEMAQMASRPFGSVQLEWGPQYSSKKINPSSISVEPCANFKAAVVTVAVRLPTGGQKYTPPGQSGLAVASALCQLTPPQVALLQAPPSPTPEQKSKRRKRSCFI